MENNKIKSLMISEVSQIPIIALNEVEKIELEGLASANNYDIPDIILAEDLMSGNAPMPAEVIIDGHVCIPQGVQRFSF